MATLPATITPVLARRIETWPVGRLVPYARNARTQQDAATPAGDTWALMDVSTDPWRQNIIGVY
jgi:hypothetical protein